MHSDAIIHDLVTGEHHPIDDADDITAHDGLESVELHHRSPDGESVVVLTYSADTQFRRDPDSSTSEFDIFDVEVKPTEEAA